MRVRRRPVRGDLRRAGCAFVLVVFSVVFAVAAVPALPGAGAILFLLVGLAGTVLFAGGLVTTIGRSLDRRTVLELDDQGVRLPTPWPWPRRHDRLLAWPDMAAAVVWNRPVPRGRLGMAEHLAFLPTTESAGRTRPAPSAEVLALGLRDLPGVATERWATQIHPGWDTAAEAIIAEVRRHGVPAVDARTR